MTGRSWSGQNVKVSTVAGNNGAADVTLKSVSLSGFDSAGDNGSTGRRRTAPRACRLRNDSDRRGGLVCDSTLRVAQRAAVDAVLDAAP